MSAFTGAAPRRTRARGGRPGRAAAPGGCPRRGCRPRPARRRARSSSARGPSGRGGAAESPPGPRSSEIVIPDDVPISIPASPGTFCSWSALERERSRRGGAPLRWPRTEPFARHKRSLAPAEPRRQPAAEQDARHAGVRRGGERSRSRSARAPRASAAGRTSPPPARARASCAARRGPPRTRPPPAPWRAAAPTPASGSFTESISTTCASRSSASTASGWPCGAQTTVGEVGHDQRVHDRVELRQVLLAHVQQHALAHERRLARPCVARHGHRHGRVDRRRARASTAHTIVREAW